MAAISYYVDGSTGNDSNDGSSGSPLLTIAGSVTKIVAAGDGNDFTVFVRNTASYTMPASTAGVTIDTQSTSTFVFKGVNSSDTPALTTILAPATGACAMLYLRTIASATIKGFSVDFTASVADATAQRFLRARDTDGGPIIVEDCVFLGSTLGGAENASDTEIVNNGGAFSNDLGEVRYCVISNMGSTFELGGGASWAFDFHNNVVITDTTGGNPAGALTAPSIGSSSNDVRIYDNTFFIDADAGDIIAALDGAWANADEGRMDYYNNVHFYETTGSILDGFVGGRAGSGSFSSGTVGYNVFYGGPGVASGDVSSVYGDTNPWDSQPYTGDVTAVYESAATVLFADPTTTYSWTGSGGGYTMTVPKDLRLVAHTAAGLSASVPGALPAATGNMAVTQVVSDAAPEQGDAITLTVTLTNEDSFTITGVTATFSIPAGLAATPTPTLSAGAYAGGVWTVNVAGSGSETATFALTVEDDASGPYTVTSTITGADFTDTDATDDVATTTVTLTDVDDQTDPESPAQIPYLDVRPWFIPTLTVDVDLRLKTTRNRVRGGNFLVGEDDRYYNEYDLKLYAVATNTTTNLRQGGVEQGDILLLESDNEVQVSINGSSLFYPVATAVCLLVGSFTSVWVRNNSTTNTATVRYVVVD